MSVRYLCHSVAVAVLLSSCGDNTVVTPTDVTLRTPSILSVADIDNLGNGADLVVRILPPPDSALASEYRLIVARAPLNTLDTGAALAVPSDRFLAISVGGGEREVSPGPDAVDMDGDPVVEGVGYQVAVVAVSGAPDVRSSVLVSREVVTLERANVVRTISPLIQAGSGGMEVDAEGRVYMADFGLTLGNTPGTRIYRMTPAGEVSVFANGLLGASGNVLGTDGTLYQSNIAGQSISRVTSAGVVTSHASSGFGGPVGITVAAGSSGGADTLYVADCGGNAIVRVRPDGTSDTFSNSGLLSCPNGITLASDGNLYVANFNNGDVLRVTPTGTVTRFHTIPGNNNGHLVWGNDVLYVVARGGNQLYELTLNGDLTLLAGTGTRGLRDGTATNATLSLPNDVALSPDGGMLWFNDVAQTTQGPGTISPVVIRAVIFVDPPAPGTR